MEAKDFVPEGRDNHYVDPLSGHILVCRSGQSLAALIAELENEPVFPPVPKPRDLAAEIDALKLRIAALETKVTSTATKTDAGTATKS